jgi:hypothetical protein
MLLANLTHRFPSQMSNSFRMITSCVQMMMIIIMFSGCAAQRGLWPPRPRDLVITHNEAPQSVGLLWTSDQLAAEFST